jgi:hypothetical protein
MKLQSLYRHCVYTGILLMEWQNVKGGSKRKHKWYPLHYCCHYITFNQQRNTCMRIKFCELWMFHLLFNSVFSWRVLGHNALYSLESEPRFQINISPPSSGSKNKPKKTPAWKQVSSRDCDKFLRNVRWLSTDYVALYPRRYNHRSENLKSCIQLFCDTIFLSRYHKADLNVDGKIILRWILEK